MQNKAGQYNWWTQQVFVLLYLTLNDVRVVLQEEVVQVLWDEGGHAGICQRCEKRSMKGSQKLEKST